MKKIITSNISEGVRKLGAVKAFFEHIEAAYVSIFNELIYGIVATSNGPVALYGCINSGAGSTYTISGGAIYHNGEVFLIPAFSGVAGGGQVPVLNLVETKTQLAYTDNTNQDTLNNRTYVWVFGASGSGLADFGAVVTLSSRINTNLLNVPGQIGSAVAALVASSPAALDTLNELAAALANDPNFATTITNALALKAPLASPALTGNPTAPTQSPGDNSTKLATTAYANAIETLVNAAIALKANIASPTFTGTPAAPTAAPGTNTTQLATTAFVKAAIDAIVAAAPGVLDTLDELAAALGDDANFASTVTTALAGKLANSGTSVHSGTIEVAGGLRSGNNGAYQKWTNPIAIGDWNMDTDAIKTVAHGIADFKTIIEVHLIIRTDDDSGRYVGGGMDIDISILSTVVSLQRRNAGGFDSTVYDSTSYNRGWIIVKYLTAAL